MYIYKLLLANFILLVIFTFGLLPSRLGYVPTRYRDKFFSNTKLSIIINKVIFKILKNKEERVDLFHEIPFISLFISFFIILIIFVFDISFENSISIWIGEFGVKIILVILTIPSALYYLFFETWWRITNNKENKNRDKNSN